VTAGPLELPATELVERPDVDWDRHRGDKRPKIVPPPGGEFRNPTTGRKVGHRYYTRVTTYADALSEQYQLTAWKLRRLALGLGQRADYVRLAASYTDHDRDRDDLDELVGKALEAAGPNAADLGTALHSLTERVDRDEDLGTPPDEVLPDLAAYTVIAAEAIRYRYREARTVCDQLECAGTPDGHAHLAERCPAGCGPEVLHIIDTKTGQIRYPGKMSTQLAIYAHSDLYDPRTGERTPIEVCRKWGAIVHLPVERGEAALFWIDLEHGWRGAELAGPVREWRAVRADEILRPFETIRPVRVVDGEVTRPEPRLASVNLKTEGAEPRAKAEPLADVTDALKVSSERVAEPVTELPALEAAVERDDAGDEAALHEDLEQPATAAPDASRCPSLELSNDPGARQCKLPAGHFGPHEFETATVPVERCSVTDLRIGECAGSCCRPDLADVGDDGVQPDDGPTELPDVHVAPGPVDPWPGVDDVPIEQLASGPDSDAEDDEPADGAAPGQDAGGVSDPVGTYEAAVQALTDGGIEVEVLEPGSHGEQAAAGDDPLAHEILACVTVRDLELLSSLRWPAWQQQHRDLAIERHDVLEREQAARKPIAAFEAAVAAAKTRADLLAVMNEVGGAEWMTEQLEALAGARWREVPA